MFQYGIDGMKQFCFHAVDQGAFVDSAMSQLNNFWYFSLFFQQSIWCVWWLWPPSLYSWLWLSSTCTIMLLPPLCLHLQRSFSSGCWHPLWGFARKHIKCWRSVLHHSNNRHVNSMHIQTWTIKESNIQNIAQPVSHINISLWRLMVGALPSVFMILNSGRE